jgi:hypothetical protein
MVFAQKQMWRPVDQNREPVYESTQLHQPYFWQRHQKPYNAWTWNTVNLPTLKSSWVRPLICLTIKCVKNKNFHEHLEIQAGEWFKCRTPACLSLWVQTPALQKKKRNFSKLLYYFSSDSFIFLIFLKNEILN